MSINWPRFVEIVQAHDRFLLTSHVRPDCDNLGSQLGMALILESLGKQVQIVDPHPVPPNLAFIDPQRRIKQIGVDVAPADLADVQVMMILDTSAWVQLGDMADVLRSTGAKKLVIDHHVSEDDLGAELFKNTKAEAAGRLIVEAADALDVELTPEMATPLFAAIATDTGWFRFSSTTSLTYNVAARLTEAGADPGGIYRSLYEQETLPRLNLRGRILSRAATELDGRLIHTAVLPEDFQETGAHPADTEDAVNLTLSVAGTEVAVILVAQATGGFKISFRSRCAVDCSALAGQFGGGGHKAAAGAFINEPLDSARQKVLDAARQALLNS